MPPLHTQIINHKINKPLLHIQVTRDYYHMTTTNYNCKLDETSISLVKFYVNLRAPYDKSTFTLDMRINIKVLFTREFYNQE